MCIFSPFQFLGQYLMNNFSNDFSAEGFDEGEDDSVYEFYHIHLAAAIFTACFDPNDTIYSMPARFFLFENRFNFADPDASSHFQSAHDDV